MIPIRKINKAFNDHDIEEYLNQLELIIYQDSCHNFYWLDNQELKKTEISLIFNKPNMINIAFENLQMKRIDIALKACLKNIKVEDDDDEEFPTFDEDEDDDDSDNIDTHIPKSEHVRISERSAIPEPATAEDYREFVEQIEIGDTVKEFRKLSADYFKSINKESNATDRNKYLHAKNLRLTKNGIIKV